MASERHRALTAYDAEEIHRDQFIVLTAVLQEMRQEFAVALRRPNGERNGRTLGWRHVAMILGTLLLFLLGGVGVWLKDLSNDIRRINGIQKERKTNVERIESLDTKLQAMSMQLSSLQGQMDWIRSELERLRRPMPPF